MIYKNIIYAIEFVDTEFYENNKLKKIGKTYRYLIPVLNIMSLYSYEKKISCIKRARKIILLHNKGKLDMNCFMDTKFLIPNPNWYK